MRFFIGLLWLAPLWGFASPVDSQIEASSSSTTIVSDDFALPQSFLIPEKYRRNIRVGLSTQSSEVKLDCSSQCFLELDSNNSGKAPDAIKVFLQQGSLMVESADKRFQSIRSLLTVQSTDPEGSIHFAGNSYRGRIEIAVANGKLRIVNDLPVEDYLKGVVPHEIGKLDSTMTEALKAQAVAARTYAYKHFGSRASLGFDVFADVRDQVYEGRRGETSLANKAIDESRGLVLQYQGQLIEAYYHSTCAGHTEGLETWKKAPLPYLRAVADLDPNGVPWCSGSSYQRWSVQYTWDELARIIKRYSSSANPDRMPSFHSVLRIESSGTLPGGRQARITVVTDNGNLTVWGDKVRWLFRMPKNPERTLPSANFDITQNAQGLLLSGKGYGHGIGMCQMGVRARAKAGQTVEQILLHYYQGAELVRW